MGTLKEELEHGCLSKALPDEPMFVLLARDAQAPRRVRDWAAQRTSDISLGKKPESDQALVQEAYQCAERMEAWREEHDGKWRTGLFADEPVPMGESCDEMIRRGMLGKDA